MKLQVVTAKNIEVFYFLVDGMGGAVGADACHYQVYCQTVCRSLAHRYKRLREQTNTVSKRNGPPQEGLQSAMISSNRMPHDNLCKTVV